MTEKGKGGRCVSEGGRGEGGIKVSQLACSYGIKTGMK